MHKQTRWTAAIVGILLFAAGCGGGKQTSNPPAQAITVAITSRPPSVTAGTTYQFSATVGNTTITTVTWKLTCAQGMSNCGTIAASGNYTAPSSMPQATSVTVTATSVADTSKSDSHSFTLNPGAIAVSITTHPAVVNAGLTYSFAATVTNTTNTPVTWKIACAPGVSDCGSIAGDGTYTAPASAVSSMVTVTATSAADTTKSDSYAFGLWPAIAVAITAPPMEIVLGFPYQFAATTANDIENHGVLWSVNGISGGNAQVGTIAADGMYLAPAGSPQTVTITATAIADHNRTASVSVPLINNPHPDFVGTYTLVFSAPGGLGFSTAAGTLTLDGAGHLTATMDISSGPYGALNGVTMTGIYGLESNNTGSGRLTYSAPPQTVSIGFRFALLSGSVAKVMEFDGQGGGLGTIEKQQATGLTTALDGPRVLSLTGLSNDNYNPQMTMVGTFDGSGGSLTGVYDLVGYENKPLTGSYSFTGNKGTLQLRYQAWINQATNVTSDFNVYPVSSDKAFVISTAMPWLIGTIEKQTGGPYSTAAFTGNWVYSLRTTNATAFLNTVQLGRISADGSGVNASAISDAQGEWYDGPPTYGALDTYSVAANGRGSAANSPLVFYFVTPQRGYIASSYAGGEFFLQQDTPFTAGSLTGAYSLVFEGVADYFFNPGSINELGVLMPDGSGSATLVTASHDPKDYAEPLKYPWTRTGTYSIDDAGRGLLWLDGGNFTLRFYAVSGSKLLLMRLKANESSYGMIGFGTADKPDFSTP